MPRGSAGPVKPGLPICAACRYGRYGGCLVDWSRPVWWSSAIGRGRGRDATVISISCAWITPGTGCHERTLCILFPRASGHFRTGKGTVLARQGDILDRASGHRCPPNLWKHLKTLPLQFPPYPPAHLAWKERHGPWCCRRGCHRPSGPSFCNTVDYSRRPYRPPPSNGCSRNSPDYAGLGRTQRRC